MKIGKSLKYIMGVLVVGGVFSMGVVSAGTVIGHIIGEGGYNNNVNHSEASVYSGSCVGSNTCSITNLCNQDIDIYCYSGYYNPKFFTLDEDNKIKTFGNAQYKDSGYFCNIPVNGTSRAIWKGTYYLYYTEISVRSDYTLYVLRTKCTACPKGTYSPDMNQLTQCESCIGLPENAERTSRGTSSTTCQWRCIDGYIEDPVTHDCIMEGLPTCLENQHRAGFECVDNVFTGDCALGMPEGHWISKEVTFTRSGAIQQYEFEHCEAYSTYSCN